MTLRWTTIDLPWAGGVDDKRHPYLRELPKAETLVNLRFQQSGAWVARDGYTNLGGPAQEPYSLVAWADTLLHANRAGVWRLDQPSGNWRELETPGPRAVDVARKPIVRNERGCRIAFSAAQNGHVVHVWSRTFETDGDVWCRVDNAETGAVVYGPVVLAGITTAVTGVPVSASVNRAVLQAVAHENQYVSVFARDAVGGILAASVTLLITSAGAVTVGSAVAHTGVGETLIVDAVQNNAIVVGAAATERIHRFVRSGTALSLESTCVCAGLGTILSVCFASSTSRAVALGVSGGAITYATASVASSLPPTATPGTAWTLLGTDESPSLAVGVELTEDGEGVFCVQSGPGTAPQQLRFVGFDDAGDCYSETDWVQWHLGIVAWPWKSAEGIGVIPLCAPLVPESDGISTTAFRRAGMLAEFEWQPEGSDFFVRRIGVFGGDILRQMETSRRSHSYTATPGGRRIFGNTTETLLGAGETRYEAPIPTYQCDWWAVAEEKQGTWRGESNGAALIASGLLATVDGIRHAEQMQMPPPVMQTVLAYTWSPGGGSGAFPGLEVATGTWAFRACWMWRDNLGNVHRSAPSEAIVRTMEADPGPPSGSTNAIQSVRVAVPPFAEWRRDGGADAILPTDLYLEFYTSPRAPILPPTNVVSINEVYERIAHGTGYTANPLVASPILTDERRISPLVDIIDPADPAWTIPLTIVGGATGTSGSVNDFFDLPLYTNGTPNVLENDPAPCPLHCASTRDRVWMIDSEDRFSVWYSKPIQPGVGVEFNALLTLRVPTEAGELVALGAVDDLVLLMSSSSIFGLDTAENGPDSTGTGDFPPLRRISREVGCVNAASVITTDVGCFFASAAGIYLVQGTGQLTWVGRDLGDDVDVSTIVSAHVVPERKEVVFATATTLLVYDYDHGQWTRVVWTGADGPTEDAEVVSTVVYGGETVTVSTDGRAWQEDGASQEGVTYQARTGWIHLAGLQGFKKVRRFGLLGRIAFDPTPTPPFDGPVDFGTLSIRAVYDYDETQFEDYTIALADVYTRLDPMRLRFHMSRQKCQSVAFRFTYSPPSGGQGQLFYGRPEIVGLALEVGTKGRLYPRAHSLGYTPSEG